MPAPDVDVDLRLEQVNFGNAAPVADVGSWVVAAGACAGGEALAREAPDPIANNDDAGEDFVMGDEDLPIGNASLAFEAPVDDPLASVAASVCKRPWRAEYRCIARAGERERLKCL